MFQFYGLSLLHDSNFALEKEQLYFPLKINMD